jgi:hypothetical protein
MRKRSRINAHLLREGRGIEGVHEGGSSSLNILTMNNAVRLHELEEEKELVNKDIGQSVGSSTFILLRMGRHSA